MTTCPTCSKPLGNDRFCIGPLTAPHPVVYPKNDYWTKDEWEGGDWGSPVRKPVRLTMPKRAGEPFLSGLWPHRKAV